MAEKRSKSSGSTKDKKNSKTRNKPNKVENKSNKTESKSKKRVENKVERGGQLKSRAEEEVKNRAETKTSIFDKINFKKKGVLFAAVAVAVVVIGGILIFSNSARMVRPAVIIEGIDATEQPMSENDTTIRLSSNPNLKCTITNKTLDDDLVIDENSEKDSFQKSLEQTDLFVYAKYGLATCELVLDGHYEVDPRVDAELKLVGDDELTDKYDLETQEDGSFVLKRVFTIYANRGGAPSSEAEKFKLQLIGHVEDDRKPKDITLVDYDLALDIDMTDEDKKFIDDWKTKIDNKIAEEKKQAEAEQERIFQEAINNAITVDYTDLFRNANQYKGTYIKITGRILQTDSSNSYCRIATGKSRTTYYDDVVWVDNCGSKDNKYLEDDIVEIIGAGDGTKTYTTVMNASEEIPRIKGIAGRILKSR